MAKLNLEMTKLKPCPFCGGYAFTGQFDYSSGHSVWHVYHMSDNCYLNSILPDFETEEEAIEAWNRRAGDTEALRKAARKLAWIHQQIDLYDDRQELHEEDYWMDYLTDPEWGDPDIEWKGEE